jgi:predicted nucleic acid-binding protein
MKQVCLDSHVLIWGVQEQAEPGQEEMSSRAKALIDHCKKNHIQMMVPALVVGELLTAIEPRYHAAFLNLLNSSFVILPYDGAAAAVFARLWRERKNSAAIDRIRPDSQAIPRELKADCMIVATGIAHKATTIYSHDDRLKKFANGLIDILDIPPVQYQENLDLILD